VALPGGGIMTVKAKNIFIEPTTCKQQRCPALHITKKAKGGVQDAMSPRVQVAKKITHKEEVNGKK